MEGEGVDFYCWHCLHNCLGGQFCGTLLPLYSVFGHFTGPPEWPPINQLRQWWFPALKSQLNIYETPLFKQQTLRKGEEKEENLCKGRQSLGRSVKKKCKKRLQRHQKLSTAPRILQYVGTHLIIWGHFCLAHRIRTRDNWKEPLFSCHITIWRKHIGQTS